MYNKKYLLLLNNYIQIKNNYSLSFFIQHYLGNGFVWKFFSYDSLLVRVSSEVSSVVVFLLLLLAKSDGLSVSLSCTFSRLSLSSSDEEEEEGEESFVLLTLLYDLIGIDCFL